MSSISTFAKFEDPLLKFQLINHNNYDFALSFYILLVQNLGDSTLTRMQAFVNEHDNVKRFFLCVTWAL